VSLVVNVPAQQKPAPIATLLHAEEIGASDLAGLYRARWNAELDLRTEILSIVVF
jgi:hypothetical protein